MTIQVLIRLWMHSTTSVDVTLLSRVISELINPHSSANISYRAMRPMLRDTFSLISVGFDDQPTEFFSKFVSRMLWLSFEDLPQHMEFLLNVNHIGRMSHNPTYMAFTNTAARCHTLWSNSFALLRLTAQRRPLFDHNCQRISQAIIGNAAFCLHSIQGKHHQCRQLIQHWALSDLFGTLDDVLPVALYSPYFAGL